MNMRWMSGGRCNRGVMASLLATVAFIVIACGGGGSKKSKDVADTKDTVKVSAVDLFQAYKDNEVAAAEKYTDKVVEVQGTVNGVKDGYVELNEDNGQFQLGLVHITPNAENKARLASLNKGQSIRVRGYCKGKGFAAVNVEDAVFLDQAGNAPEDKPGESTPEKDAAVKQVSAVELFSAYKNNEVAANNAYKGKTVEIRGTIHGFKSRYVELDENDGQFQLGLVHVTLSGKSKDKMASLKKSQSIEVRGVCTGKSFASVDVKDAVLLD